MAQFEFIPWILVQCATVEEVREKLAAMRLTGTAFSEQLPTAQLHWIIADKDSCIVVESMKDGLHVYDNPVGVLTNNPPFPGQIFALNNYAGVSRKQPESTFAEVLQLDAYSRGMGGMGIPGDLSSQSRFVKVAFTKLNSCLLIKQISATSSSYICSSHARSGTDAKERKVFASES